MKTNTLLKISNLPATRKSKLPANKQNNNGIQAINKTVNDIWTMYQNQLQRNAELMAIIERQQQYIQTNISNKSGFAQHPLQPSAVLTPALELPPPPFKELSIEQVSKYTAYFKVIFVGKVRRLDAIQGIIRLLYTLHHLGGSAYHDTLIEKAGLVDSTARRYITLLRGQGLLKGRGVANFDHKYHLLEKGRLFLQGKLEKEGFIFESQKKRIPSEALID